MATEIHRIVQDSDDLDHGAAIGAVQDKMSPPSAAARNMEASEISPHFITRDAAGEVGAKFQRAQGFEQNRSLDHKLLFAKCVRRVFQNAKEVFLGLIAEKNTPTGFNHFGATKPIIC